MGTIIERRRGDGEEELQLSQFIRGWKRWRSFQGFTMDLGEWSENGAQIVLN